jgi:sugar/nucleoside kinase (ribokinase family)
MSAAPAPFAFSGPEPAFLAVGHVTRDLLPTAGFALGGTVTFAALTAARLGLSSAIVTRADEALSTQLSALLPGVALAVLPSEVTTTFENRYTEGFRVQYVRACAAPLTFADLPPAWLDAPVLLLGPLAQEISLEMIQTVRLRSRSAGSLLAATPQGWLRRWDSTGRVWPTPWTAASAVLPLLDALILSYDDLLPFAEGSREGAASLLQAWSQLVPLLVATDGRHGATLFVQGQPTHFPACPAREVDPTGAGDVFAAAFLLALWQQGDPYVAMRFAHGAASLAIEHSGTSGIPSLEQIEQRLRSLPE